MRFVLIARFAPAATKQSCLRSYKALPFLTGMLTHGTSVDIHAMQNGAVGSIEHERMARVHAAAKQYPNEVEHLYSFMQVLTACTASFAHGGSSFPLFSLGLFAKLCFLQPTMSPTLSVLSPLSTRSGRPESLPLPKPPSPSGSSPSELPSWFSDLLPVRCSRYFLHTHC